MVIGRHTIGSVPIGADPVKQASEVVEKIETIPVDAKKAIKDLIQDLFEKTWNTLEELQAVQPPAELMEYWEIFIEALKVII
ncbi:hypothetical protein FLL45_01585 [Aliikangiella marina]|uniref:Uncharacterized protein n=1 Tax=Aliikangiella marina TaxID=1712262 RepID=A0A545THG8_9GAMM|nr:hypothetical protein [Aliikangiella marina]TQV76679.1 hypothetical protein FLL45_01585 [Aliikangiella marina]